MMRQLHTTRARLRALTLTLMMALLVSLLVAPEARAQDDDAVRARVEVMLGGIEHAPSPEAWRALGAEAVPILVEVASDPSTLVVTRGRAISALSHFATPESAQALEVLLADERSPKLLQRKALRAISRVQGELALEVIEPFLGHQDFALRESAIQAVADVGTAQAQRVLERHLEVEPAEPLRVEVSRTITLLEQQRASGVTPARP